MESHNKLDWFFILIVGIILVFSLIVLYSATYKIGYGYIIKQGVWMSLGFCVFCFVSRFDCQRIGFISLFFYLCAICLLIWVLLNGRSISGSKRWIHLFGLTLQPSEFMKLCYILLMSACLDRLKFKKKQFKHLLFLSLITFIPIVLIAAEPDLGTALVFVPIYIGMLFVSDFPLFYFAFISLGGMMTLPFVWFFILRPYQQQRVLMFLNPQNNQFGFGWTINQSKIAIGSGKIWGRGWLKGSQTQLNFLPEHHTDFIFSVLAEEFGFLGVLILFMLFALFFTKGIMIASRTKSAAGKYMIIGILVLFFFQMVINIGMTFGAFPVTGLPLPFFSYGGSSLLMSFISVGIIVAVDRYNN